MAHPPVAASESQITVEQEVFQKDSSARKSIRISAATLAAAVIFVIAITYRVYLIFQDSPALGGDESVIGIMAIHIMDGVNLPAFYYGQHYMGSLQAFLAGPFLAIFGPSVQAVRMGTLLLYAGFFWAMFWTTRRISSPWFAVLTVTLLALGSDRLLRQELVANGGWQELLLFGALLAGLTAWICTSARDTDIWAYAVWGLLAGLGLWASVMIVPNLAMLAMVLLLFRWRKLLGWRSAALLAGVLVGLIPVIIHNRNLPLSEGTLGNVLAYNPETPSYLTTIDHVRGTVHGLSLATGMCNFECLSWQIRWWGPAYLILIASAILVGLVGFWRARQQKSHADQIRAAMFMALGLGAVGTVALYFQSIHSGQVAGSIYPIWDTSRYLNNLLLATPAVLWPLWRLIRVARRSIAGPVPKLRILGGGLATVVLAGVFATAGTATASTLTDGLQKEREVQRRHTQLLAELNRRGIERLYTDYFTCHKLIYVTRERIICGTLNAGLVAGYDRWQPYPDTLAADPKPYYVFDTGSILDVEFQRFLESNRIGSERYDAGTYTIYLPSSRLPIPKR